MLEKEEYTYSKPYTYAADLSCWEFATPRRVELHRGIAAGLSELNIKKKKKITSCGVKNKRCMKLDRTGLS